MKGIEWAEPGRAAVLVGGQFGSEGKGLAAAWLAHNSRRTPTLATTNAGAQAGHTTKYKDQWFNRAPGFVCYHLPTTSVALQIPAYINAGSIIDVEALMKEMKDTYMEDYVSIHGRAAVITPENKLAERSPRSSTAGIASTQKGVGAAIADKIMRRAALAMHHEELARWTLDSFDFDTMLMMGEAIVVEVPQGADLSINHGFSYPYCTSRDCWVGSGLSDAGIHPRLLGRVCMVIRTLPIRVGHLSNEMGEKIGDSGPFYKDSRELDWARDLPGVEPERTTVTKRIRRIASWSDEQYRRGLVLNRPDIVFVNFTNYLRNARGLELLDARMTDIEQKLGMGTKKVYGFGPCVEDVVADYDQAMAWFDKRSL